IATMFWLKRFCALVEPWPLMPTTAMFTRSLGAVSPRPSTWRGTMVRPAPAIASVDTKSRLDMPPSGFFTGASWMCLGHLRTGRVEASRRGTVGLQASAPCRYFWLLALAVWLLDCFGEELRPPRCGGGSARHVVSSDEGVCRPPDQHHSCRPPHH